MKLILSTSALKSTGEAATLDIYKSTGPDMLHPWILHALEDKLARPLTHIFNNSVETGIIPKTGNQQTRLQFTRKEAGKNLETADPLVLLL